MYPSLYGEGQRRTVHGIAQEARAPVKEDRMETDIITSKPKQNTPPYLKGPVRQKSATDIDEDRIRSISIRFKEREIQQLNNLIIETGARGYRDVIMKLCRQPSLGNKYCLWKYRKMLRADSIFLSELAQKNDGLTSEELSRLERFAKSINALTVDIETILMELQ